MGTWLEAFRRADEIQDDRGRLVRVPGEISHGEEDDAELKLISQIDAKRPKRKAIGARFETLMLVLILACAMLLTSVLQRAGLSGFVSNVGGWAGAFGLLAILSWPYAQMARRKEAASLLWFRRCGVCSSSLRGLVVQEDGCVVCPECSAAWRAGRFGSEVFLDRLKKIALDENLRRRYEDVFGNIRTIHDVDGSAVLLTPPGLVDLSDEERAAVSEADRKVLDQVMAGAFERGAVILGLLLLIAGLLALAVLTTRTVPTMFSLQGLQSLAFIAIALVGVWFFGRVIVRVARGPIIANRAQYVAAHLQIGRCPSCAASLRGVAVNDDGNSWTCRKCESRWTPGWTGDEPK
ncbi:MAG: hypothetical protein IBJ18_13520 [Phycisphaerales bacterium]|nr:hypothetical protein [Phycisphaerales bacterium]